IRAGAGALPSQPQVAAVTPVMGSASLYEVTGARITNGGGIEVRTRAADRAGHRAHNHAAEGLLGALSAALVEGAPPVEADRHVETEWRERTSGLACQFAPVQIQLPIVVDYDIGAQGLLRSDVQHAAQRSAG